jgi:hypothetical protein
MAMARQSALRKVLLHGHSHRVSGDSGIASKFERLLGRWRPAMREAVAEELPNTVREERLPTQAGLTYLSPEELEQRWRSITNRDSVGMSLVSQVKSDIILSFVHWKN